MLLTALTWIIIWIQIPSEIMQCNVLECTHYERNYTEEIIDNITSRWKLVYRLWCNWLWVCKSNGFDCSGLIDRAWRDVGYYDWRKLSSHAMIDAGERIHYTDIQRWDYIRLKRIVGEGPDHIAIVSRWYSGHTIEILDMMPWSQYVLPREIKIFNGRYAGKFRVDAMRMDYNVPIVISRKTWKLLRLITI